MRVLLACSIGGEGHLTPLAAVGRAIERAGHEVKLLVPPSLASGAQRTALPHVIGDEPPVSVVEDVWRRVREGTPDEIAGLVDRELFAMRCTPAMLPTARAIAASWKPDLVLRESCEYAAAVVAHERGIAHGQVAVSLAAIESGVREMVAPIIDQLGDGTTAAIRSAPYLSHFPPSMDPSTWLDTRRYKLEQPVSNAPWSSLASGDAPLVYLSFGTVLGHLHEAIDAYRIALQVAAGLRARVLLTVGEHTDMAGLEKPPPNVRVERWVPQDVVLRQASVVVSHGGSGTTFGALAAGVPVIVCPMFADQPRNGQAVAEAGAGVVVAGGGSPAGGIRRLTGDDVAPLRRAIEVVLGEDSFRRAAQRIASEIAAMPALTEVVERLCRSLGGVQPPQRGGC
jgi:UDP:flavonoid glycosyltransferase YjiC (YdhE family)